jgi:hypothetical protein
MAAMLDTDGDTFINTRSREILGIEYKRSMKELYLETAESMMKSGAIPTRRKIVKKK